jgi:copper ion binding protein
MTTNSYTVSGMTCGHCVAAVKSEVGQVAGVTDVTVDLEAGRLAVTSEGPIDDALIREAVDEAGYQVTVRP